MVGRARLSGRAAGTAGAAASAGMSLLTNRCWPCRPVFGKIQTGRDVRSVDKEGEEQPWEDIRPSHQY